MSAMEVDSASPEKYHMRPKRHRNEMSRILSGTNADQEPLELEGVINVLKEYEDYGGGINCRVCGKLYKSRVCFIKHLWEHSIYWDLFDGAKNHDRVLSIQAALILYNGHTTTNTTSNNEDNNILSLLVTSPHISDKKKDLNNNEVKSPVKSSSDLRSPVKSGKSPSKTRSPHKSKSPCKRKRSLSGSSTSSNSSTTTTTTRTTPTPHVAMDLSMLPMDLSMSSGSNS